MLREGSLKTSYHQYQLIAALIEVVSAADFEKEQATSVQDTNRSADSFILPSGNELQAIALHKGKTINVALVGNPKYRSVGRSNIGFAPDWMRR